MNELRRPVMFRVSAEVTHTEIVQALIEAAEATPARHWSRLDAGRIRRCADIIDEKLDEAGAPR